MLSFFVKKIANSRCLPSFDDYISSVLDMIIKRCQPLYLQGSEYPCPHVYLYLLVVKSKGKITGSFIVRHLPREISRFCKFYVGWRTRLCIPQGGLEIPINLKILQSYVPDRVFDIMKEKV